ncbi:MAG TPA: hypothetical protein ENN12_03235, partial [Epsilonproteobacteria bacterium]|nr:hypothetical protein [Campylobacterota bacterium]
MSKNTKTTQHQLLFDFDALENSIQTDANIKIEASLEPMASTPPDSKVLNARITTIEKNQKSNRINNIEDAGEKIGGARKDFSKKGLSEADFNEMNSVEKEKSTKRDNIWRMPRAENAMKMGYNPYVYTYANEVRKAIPTSPYNAKKTQESISDKDVIAYIRFVTFVKESLEKAFFAETLGEAQRFLKEQMVGTYFEVLKERNGRTGYGLTEEGRSVSRFIDSQKSKTQLFDLIFNPHIFNHYGKFNKEWDDLLNLNKDQELTAKKIKNSDIKTLVKQAYYLSHVVRAGCKEYRKDKQIQLTSESFMNTFGFRAVEFGNWLRQTKELNEREEVLNHAYDAFMDFAEAMDIPPKAIGLGGRLAIAFGSRGKGGKNAASAHYEPSRMVINLTKLKGAGSLAHEWFHAVDNLLGTKIKGIENDYSLLYASENYTINDINHKASHIEKSGETDQGDFQRVCDAVRIFETTKLSLLYGHARKFIADENYNSLYSTIEDFEKYSRMASSERYKNHYVYFNKREFNLSEYSELYLSKVGGFTDFYKSSRSLDLGKTKKYFSKPIELMARAFETYVVDKLIAKGMRSDYLVAYQKGNENFLNTLVYVKNGEQEKGVFDVYPAKFERRMFREYFDTLMETISMSGIYHMPKPKEEITEIKSITIGDKRISLIRDNRLWDQKSKYEARVENTKTGEIEVLNSTKETLNKADNSYHRELFDMIKKSK